MDFLERFMSLTETEKAYLAGLFDGEGGVGVYETKIEGLVSKYVCNVGISNTKECIMEWLVSKLGGSITTSKGKKINHNTSYLWRLTTRDDMRLFIRAILPYSIIKKNELELMYAFLRAPANDYKLRAELISALKLSKGRKDESHHKINNGS